MMRKFVLALLFFCCTTQVWSQDYTTVNTTNKKAKKWYDSSTREAFNGQPKDALNSINQALRLDPNFIDAHIQWANLQYDLGDYNQAEAGFMRVVGMDPNYSENAFYNLGLIGFKLKNYDKAGDYFQMYLDSDPKSTRRKQKAVKHLSRARVLAKATKNPVPFEPINLGPNINTPGDEYLPSLTADGQTLIYNVFRGNRINGDENFYTSKMVANEWQLGQPVNQVNTPYNEGAQSLSPNGRLLIFTACERKNGIGSCDLYYSEYTCDGWSKVKILPQPISTTAWESQPSISADGNTIYFSSNRKGTLGGKDLWMSQRMPNGKWQEPINLGDQINTSSDEKAPFIHPDGQTLYFLSEGHPGMGGTDLFVARKEANGVWGKPTNLGYPINSTSDEGPLIVSTDGQTAYFSSMNAFEGAQGKMDIYSFELYEAARPQPVTYTKAIVKDEETNAPLVAAIEIIDLASGQTLSKSTSDCEGEFLVTLPIGKNYMLNINKEGYLFHSENFALDNSSGISDPFELKIKLVPVPKDLTNSGETPKPNATPIVLKNVFFETGSSALLDISKVELNRLKTMLENYPNLRIQINGHTDNVGSDEANLNLSTDRAKAVHDFLVEKGINRERLKYKGFGETDPIATNTNEIGRQKNRRTEFVIIE